MGFLSVARSAGLAALVLLLGALLGGLWRLDVVSRAGCLAVAGWALLSAAAPHASLLVLASILPIAGTIAALLGVWLPGPSFAEVLVLGLLFGRAARGLVVPPPAPGRGGIAALTVALLAAAWAAALVPVMLARAAPTREPLQFALDLITREYFLYGAETRRFHDAALVIESAALFIGASRDAASATRRRTLLRMLTVGATAAAAFNLARLFAVSLQAGEFWAALAASLRGLRINVHDGDLNAAGSFFALFLCVAAGFARGRERWWAAAAMGPLALALWLAGSRTALAALAAAVIAVALWTARRDGPRSGRRLALAVAVVTAVLAAGTVAFWPRGAANMQMRHAFAYRVEMITAGAEMIRDYPLTGVGIGQFPAFSTRYRAPGDDGAPPAAENAHNNLLQIAAELGLPGLIAVLCWIGLALAPLVSRLRRGEADQLDAAVLTGLTAFVLTWIAGHPLLVPVVAFPFWLALGAAGPDTPPRAPRPAARWAAGVAGIALAVSIPFRTAIAFREGDLEHVGVGVSGWWDSGDGVKYRRTANCAGLYVPAATAHLIVPIRLSPGAAGPLRVVFTADDRVIAAFSVTLADWVDLRVRLPEARGRFRFVGIRVEGGGDDACETARVDIAKVTTLDARGNRLH